MSEPKAKRKLNKVEKHILKGMGLTPAVVVDNVKDFYHRIGDMESDNNSQASAKSSSAKGVYQYLNENKTALDENGVKQPANSSFQTGLNRAARAYKLAGEPIPKWIEDANKHEDPRKLTQEQSDTLMISDLVYGAKTVSANMREYFIYGQSNAKALHDVYKEHHTDVTDPGQGDVQGRMTERLGAIN